MSLSLRIFLLLLCMNLLACQQPEPPPLPLLSVGQRQLTVAQFERELQSSYPDLSALPAADQLQLKKQLVNQLIERELILGEAERLDIQIGPDELDVALRDLRGNYSPEEFASIRQQAGQTELSWNAALRLRLLTEKVNTELSRAERQITSKDAEAYYLEHRDEFRRPAELRARQMLLADRATARNILKLIHDGADFAELARENSLSPDRETGGDLGYFSQGQLPPEFDKVLFRLPTGQVSNPVKSPYGIHLFTIVSRRPAGLRKFKQVETEIIEKLTQQQEEQVFHRWLNQLHEQTPVAVNWQLLTSKPAPKNSLLTTIKAFWEDR